MRVFFLNNSTLKSLKRSLAGQQDVRSAHLTEALARGFGFGTHAALQVWMNDNEGQFRIFDPKAFSDRVNEMHGGTVGAFDFPELPREDRYVEDVFDRLNVISFRKDHIQFQLPGIYEVVDIRLRALPGGWFRFDRSHAIHTPVQLGPYYPTRDIDDDAPYAMHRAIESLASYHRAAVGQGHTPSESWLVSCRS